MVGSALSSLVVRLKEGWAVKGMRWYVVAVVLSVCGVWAASASADPSVLPLCNGPETVISGSYHNLTITGNRGVSNTGTLRVWGNLTIAPGACLDAFSMGRVSIGGNVLVAPRAVFALGCGLDAVGPPPPPSPCTASTNDVVGGNIVAIDPWTMYLTADAVRGSVVSFGGGPGLTLDPYVNFPIKDMAIGGNLIVQNWQGAWFGALRNHVSGSMIVNNVTGITTGEFGPDSNEVNTNTVRGNLICFDNSPTIQFGDSGGAPNVVYGNAIGQCAFGTYLPDLNYPGGSPQPISVKP